MSASTTHLLVMILTYLVVLEVSVLVVLNESKISSKLTSVIPFLMFMGLIGIGLFANV